MAVCPFGSQGPVTPWGNFVQIRERVPSSGRMQPLPGCSVWCAECGCPHGPPSWGPCMGPSWASVCVGQA